MVYQLVQPRLCFGRWYLVGLIWIFQQGLARTAGTLHTNFVKIILPGRECSIRYFQSGEKKFTGAPLTYLDCKMHSMIISSPGPSCDIVQLAAVSGHHTLNLFMVPRCRIEPGASRITGYRVRHHRLFLHRRPVLTNSLKEALVSFITFLRMFGRPLLVGHNIRRFDCLVLARVLDEFDLKAVFQAGIMGFLDSLPLTRQLLKHRGVHSFKQENLVKTVLGVSYAAHNALGDVQALQKLYLALGPTASQIQQHIFSLDSLCKRSKDRITCVNSKSDSNGKVLQS